MGIKQKMEYLIFSLVGLAVALALAYFGMLFSKRFFIALALAVLFQIIFDNLAVSQGFWSFPLQERTGLLLGLIPLENVFFGVALFCFSVFAYGRSKNFV